MRSFTVLAGVCQEMSHGSVADAVAYADKLTKAKLKKGYADAEPPAGAGGGAGGAGAGGAGAGSKRKSAKAKPRAKPSGGRGAGAGVSEYYECRTGGSRKFWRCVLDGIAGQRSGSWVVCSHAGVRASPGDQTTVTYGKIGSPGNTVVKTYPSVEAAEAAVAKLIREKTKKGYKLAEGVCVRVCMCVCVCARSRAGVRARAEITCCLRAPNRSGVLCAQVRQNIWRQAQVHGCRTGTRASDEEESRRACSQREQGPRGAGWPGRCCDLHHRYLCFHEATGDGGVDRAGRGHRQQECHRQGASRGAGHDEWACTPAF